MYQHLTPNLVLVNNDEEFDAFVSDVIPTVPGVIGSLNIAPHPHLRRPTEYPTLITTSISTGMVFTPVAKVIGGMGNIRQLDMRNVFKNFEEACQSCVPFKQPHILLNAITIKPRTVPVGYIGHVHSTHNPDLMEAIANLGKYDAKLKSLRIQFGDGQFHGSVEMNQEMMFVAQTRDITDQIVRVSMDSETGKFTADYIFNHYDFMNATPELREYKDLSKWEISVSTSVESSLDTGKKD